MKEENFGEKSRTPGEPPQPINIPPAFDPQDRTSTFPRKAAANDKSKSGPPQRDMSGKRVDVDDIRNFGIELW